MPKESKPRASKSSGKAAKDPNAPKRPLSAYMYYSKAKRESVKEANPDISFGDVGKVLGEQWKKLSDEEKAPYNEQAADDKRRYESEKADYESKPKTAPAADDDDE